MKITNLLGLAAAVGFLPFCAFNQTSATLDSTASTQVQVTADLSSNAAEVVRLAGSGVGDEVVLAYIQNSQSAFNLSSENVLYLKDVGLSSQVITAMLNHDTSLRNQTPLPASTPQTTASTPAETTAPQETTSAAAPMYVSNPPADVTYFYDDLASYGVWLDLSGVGWCWQPRTVVINRGWRPYCDAGHWLYTDAGWYWQSDYSWGWAPFHYGRWFLHERCGWVWVPDKVWAPAWVTWRTTEDRCGWAPLPPRAVFDARAGWRFNGVPVNAEFDFGLRPEHFNFVAMRDFNDRELSRRRLPSTEVRNIYRQTTIINNTSANNYGVVNRGVPPERVSAATHTEIRKAPIRDLPAGSGGKPAIPTSERGTAVYRPALKAPAKPARIVAQKVDDRHPVVQHPPIVPARAERAGPSGPSGPASASSPASRRPPTETSTRPGVAPSQREAPPQRGNEKSPSPSSPGLATPSRRPPTETPARPAIAPSQREGSQRQPTEKSPSSFQNPSTPRTYPPSSAAPSGATPTRPSAESGSRSTRPAYQPAPETPSRSTTRPSEEKPSTRPVPAYPSASTAPSSPGKGVPNTRPADSQEQNPHVYYPKSYHQANEVHTLPPASPPREPTPPSPPSKPPESPPKKNQP